MKYGQITAAIVLCLVCSSLVLTTVLAEGKKKGTVSLSVNAIGKDVILIGRLGRPLGTPFEFAGQWHFPKKPYQKDGSIRFTIFSVDGKSLQVPITFNHEQLVFLNDKHESMVPEFADHKTLAGQTWTLTGYETGRIQMFPNENDSKSPIFPIIGRPYYTRPFTSEIVGVVKSS